MRWLAWIGPAVILMLVPARATAQSCEGDGCSAFSPCCDGYYCSALEGFECMPKRRPGQQCGPDAHCLEGFSCMPTLDSLPTCVLDSIDTAADRMCGVLQSRVISAYAGHEQRAYAFSFGDSATALVGASIEMGVAYGADGEFGCFATVCGGITSDVSIGVFASISEYNSYADIQGISVLVTGGASTPFIEIGGAVGKIFAVHAPTSLSDFASKTMIGTVGTVSIGIGLAPAQFTTNMCYTELIAGTDSVKTLDQIVQRGQEAIRKLRAEMGDSVEDPRSEAAGASVDPFSPECQRLSDERAMISRVSFGFANDEEVASWRGLQCQTRPSPEATAALCQAMSDEFRIAQGDVGRATVAVQASFESLQCTTVPGLGGTLSCQELSDHYAILSGSGFGFATPEAIEQWRTQECKTRPAHDAIPGLCQTMSNDYGISQSSYGRSTPAVRRSFFDLGCRTNPTVPQPGTRGCSGRGCASGGSSSGALVLLLVVVGSLVRVRRRRR